MKVLRHSMLQMEKGVASEFEREICFIQRTRHSSLVRFFGAGHQEDGTPFLIEELLASGTLKGLVHGGSSARELDWGAWPPTSLAARPTCTDWATSTAT